MMPGDGWILFGAVGALLAVLLRGRALALAVGGLSILASAAHLINFQYYTADDAYIIARYAANAVEIGQIVYNPGEMINAVTTPLQLAVMIPLYRLVGAERLMGAYVLLCIALSALVLAALAFRFRRTPEAVALLLALIAASPSFNLWLVGGLETPLLFAAVTLTSLIAVTSAELDDRRAGAAALLAGVGVLARYDSALFFAPVLLAIWLRQPTLRRLLIMGALGAALPLASLVFNWAYYGNLLPTSFYVKAEGTPFNVGNLIHTSEFLWMSGVLIVSVGWALVAAPVTVLRSWKALRACLCDPTVSVLIGLALMWGAYAAFFGRVHMMYGFRLYLPYLGAFALIAIGGLVRGLSQRAASAPLTRLIPLLTAVVIILQANGAFIQGRVSVDLSRVGEPRQRYWDIPRYLEALARASLMAQADWEARGIGRRARIYSPNEGLAAYLALDADVYGQLVRERRGCPTDARAMFEAMDYFIFEGLLLPILYTERWTLDDLELIWQGERYRRHHSWDGTDIVFVYRNPNPIPLTITARFDDPCPSEPDDALRDSENSIQ
jgi:arabinofuranosyltransferase